ncbi:TniQ family protein [Streptomyces sp. NPDC020298]|uniref:TniQ family protein n=1 Tax=unclassified Streptomyces TaxID=2593676 RepID=UPI0033CA5AC3
MPPTRRHPSPLRVAPMQWETTASYIQRLARRHHLTTTELLHALGIPTPHTHPECTKPGSPYTTIELYLNPASRHLITQFTGIDTTHLTHALPQWSRHRDKSPTAPPKARLRLAPVHAVTGCPHCTLTRTGHTHPVQQYRPSTALICRRHRTWMLGPHALNGEPFPTEHADLTRTPEILAAHREHTRLLRRWGQAADHGLTHAMALTEHWRRTAPADEHIWPARTRRLSTTRTRLWYALAREAITYPETIALAQLFTRHPGTLHVLQHTGRPHAVHTTIAALLNRAWLTDPAHYPPRPTTRQNHSTELTQLGYTNPRTPPRKRPGP